MYLQRKRSYSIEGGKNRGYYYKRQRYILKLIVTSRGRCSFKLTQMQMGRGMTYFVAYLL